MTGQYEADLDKPGHVPGEYVYSDLLEVREPFWRPLFLAIIGGLSGGIVAALLVGAAR